MIPSPPLGLLVSLLTKVFLGLLYPHFSFSTDLVTTQYIMSLLTLFIIFLSKLECKTPEGGEYFLSMVP